MKECGSHLNIDYEDLARIVMTVLPFDSSEWKKKLVEKASDVDVKGDALILRSGKDTDWWRTAKGSTPESDANRHSGPLYVFDVEADCQFWTAGVWLAVDHKERFQQATLFIGTGDYLDEGSTAPWLKAGVEIEHDEQNIGSVVAAPTSDWTLFVAPKPITTTTGQWLYIEAKRTGADIILSYAYGQLQNSTGRPASTHLMREVKGFAAKASNATWNVGVMTCGPKSESTVSQFHSFSFSNDAAS